MKTLKQKDNFNPKKGRRVVDDPALLERRFDWPVMVSEVAQPPLNPIDYTTAKATLGELIGVATGLVAKAGTVTAPAVARKLEALLEARDMARAYRLHLLQEAEPRIRGPRNEVATLVALEQRTLSQFVEFGGPAIAAEAEEVQRLVFGSLGDLRALSSATFWSELDGVRAVLEGQPQLRERLAALVPEVVTTRLLQALDELGQALGMTGGSRLPTMVDGSVVSAFLRGRIMRYLIQVMAAASDTPEGQQQVAGALAPLRELRNQKRRARKAGEPEDVEEEEEDDLDVAAPAVPAAPLVPAAPAAVMPVREVPVA